MIEIDPLVLEYESRLALRSFLPPEWIWRDKVPDYGIDAEVEIVENKKVTNKAFWIQLKATSMKPQGEISYQMKTKHLKYYEGCILPVLIVYWIKPDKKFYYLFAQQYIKETLYDYRPNWKDQETVKIKFGPPLTDSKQLECIAKNWRLYLLNQHPDTDYLIDAISQSCNEELKKQMLKALSHIRNEEHAATINAFESMLRACTLSPAEQMPVLLGLGNEYYLLDQNEKALRNYETVLELIKKVNEKDFLKEKSVALGNIGLIYRGKGDLDEALEYYKKAFKIHREIGYERGEASDLENIGLIFHGKGDLDRALKYHIEAFKMYKDLKYERGKANCIRNIGLVYRGKGDLDKALQCHVQALKIYGEIKYKRGIAVQSGNIGIIYRRKGDLDKAMKYHIQALKIHRKSGYKRGEASQLGNIGLIYRHKGNVDEALQCHKEAFKIYKKIKYERGEASQLGDIGLVYRAKGDVDEALQHHEKALEIHRKIKYSQGEAVQLGNIGIIYEEKGNFESALQYLQEALTILDSCGLLYGRDTITTAIERITNTQL